MKKNIIALCIFAFGCSEDNPIPKAGEWAYANLNYTPNGCNFSAPENEYPFKIVVVDRETLTFQYEDGEQTCSLSFGEYDCGTTETEVDLSPETGSYVVITETTTINGSFSDELTGTMTNIIGLSCEGEDCDNISVGNTEDSAEKVSLPCESTRSADIGWVE